MTPPAIDPRIATALEQMQRHLARPIDAAALATRVKLSPSRFRRLFAAQMGMGPSEYLQRLRLRRARILVERTFLPVADIMTLVGYHDPVRFERDFQRVHQTPLAGLRSSGAATPLPSQTPARPHVPRHVAQRAPRDRSARKAREPSPLFLV